MNSPRRSATLYPRAIGSPPATRWGEEQAKHMGIMISHLVDGKIKETFVVAREVSSAREEDWEDRKVFN